MMEETAATKKLDQVIKKNSNLLTLSNYRINFEKFSDSKWLYTKKYFGTMYRKRQSIILQ